MVLSAIVLVIIDFFTLGNKNFIQSNPKINITAFIVFAIAILLLIIGIIKLIQGLSLSNWFAARRERLQQETIKGKRFTRTERAIMIFVAVILSLPTIGVSIMVPFVGLIIAFPFIILIIYLLFCHRRHHIFNLFLLLIGIYLYFFSSENFFQLYKMIKLAVVPGYGPDNPLFVMIMNSIFGSCKYLFILAASWLVITRRCHSLINLSIFLALLVTFLLLPCLYQPKVRFGQSSTGNDSGNGASHFAMNNTTTIMSFDKNTNQYVVTSTLKNNTDQDGPIIRIIIDGKDLEISPSNLQLSLENGTISKNLILIPSGKTGILKISSPKPFFCTTLLEKDFRYSNCFLK